MLDRLSIVWHSKCAMNKLSTPKRAMILRLLCEGMSLRAISRTEDVTLNTVMRLLVAAGEACWDYHNRTVRGVKATRVQCDEIWSFVAVKQKNAPKSKWSSDPTVGDCWTWTAIEADSKLLISYMVGERDAEYAMMLMDDLRSRVASRIQLSTDGHAPYLQAVEDSFGADIDYSMLIKIYGAPSTAPDAARRYSPTECVGTKTQIVTGNPDPRHYLLAT